MLSAFFKSVGNVVLHAKLQPVVAPVRVPSTSILRESADPVLWSPHRLWDKTFFSEASFQESSYMTVTWSAFSNTALLLLCALNCFLSVSLFWPLQSAVFSAFNYNQLSTYSLKMYENLKPCISLKLFPVVNALNFVLFCGCLKVLQEMKWPTSLLGKMSPAFWI